ncbi:MAG: hypothetical protein CHACPFDD_01892 [Phycisphaerae bacterium]|nr:hypothetical protein [Phycisphaerae bacterium]
MGLWVVDGRSGRGAAGGWLAVAALGLLLALTSGCVVPQPMGRGRLTREVEPASGRGYWRYLPIDYVESDPTVRKSRRWPLVVTFHGMKPFDNAHPQACEWQSEADRYGFVVIAPELHAPDVLHQFPVRNVHPAFRDDDNATLQILDHVFANTDADPNNVLSTSWSSGGYMAHYMLNKHPDRFTCLAVRQSNFSSSVLDTSLIDRSRFHPLLIINTQNDFQICREESAAAVRWYEQNGYQNVWWVRIKNLGHERTPDIAADFFGRVAGVRPSGPSAVLARRQAIEGNPAGLALLSGATTEFRAPPEPVRRLAFADPGRSTLPRAVPVSSRGPAVPSAGGASTGKPSQAPVLAAVTPGRQVGGARGSASGSVSINVSAAFGISPLLVGFSADCPSDWATSAEFAWSVNGEAIGNTINGQRTFSEPGTYELSVQVLTRDGREHRATRTIRVIPKLSSEPAGRD